MLHSQTLKTEHGIPQGTMQRVLESHLNWHLLAHDGITCRLKRTTNKVH